MGLRDLFRVRESADDVVVAIKLTFEQLHPPATGTLAPGSPVDVVGESYYQEAIFRAAGGYVEPDESVRTDAREGALAELRPEPDNPYDAGAVGVYIGGLKVGHLSREDARTYRSLIDEVIAAQGIASCCAQIRGGIRQSDGSTSYFGIRLYLDSRERESKQVRPLPGVEANERRLLPTGADTWPEVSVTCEEHYQGCLLEATKSGSEIGYYFPALAALRMAGTNPHTKAEVAVVEVLVTGQTVGFLTPKMTDRYKPLIDAAAAEGLWATCRAEIKYGEKGGQEILRARLMLPRAESTD